MGTRGIGIMFLSVLMASGAAWADGPKGKSLYERLGGKDSITAVVDTFVANVGADKRINGYFASTDLIKLKRHLVNQICEASGGPCKYTGRTMKQTHAGMGVTDAAFGALVAAPRAVRVHGRSGGSQSSCTSPASST